MGSAPKVSKVAATCIIGHQHGGVVLQKQDDLSKRRLGVLVYVCEVGVILATLPRGFGVTSLVPHETVELNLIQVKLFYFLEETGTFERCQLSRLKALRGTTWSIAIAYGFSSSKI